MIWCLTIVRFENNIDRVKHIYFSDKEYAESILNTIIERTDCRTSKIEGESEYTLVNLIDNNKEACASIMRVNCRYFDGDYIYKIDIYDRYDKDIFIMSDLYPYMDDANTIKNIFDKDSLSYSCEITKSMVVNNEEKLETIKRSICHSRDCIDDLLTIPTDVFIED